MARDESILGFTGGPHLIGTASTRPGVRTRPPRFLARRVAGIRNARAGLLARSRTRRSSARSLRRGSARIDLRLRPGHFPARARSVIMLMQVGGPSQIDLFDPKPELRKRDGQVHSQRLRGAPARQRKQEADGQSVPVPPPRRSAGWSYRN